MGGLNFNKKFDGWLLRDLLINCQVLSKSEGLSRMIYTTKVLDVPQAIVKQTDTKLFNFVLNKRPHYLKKSALCN